MKAVKKLYRVTFPNHKAAYEAHAALGWTFSKASYRPMRANG